jgi:hypothetical protein
MKSQIRLKITDNLNNISYITISNHKVAYFGATEIPLALSNLAGNQAAELRFALEDAASAGGARGLVLQFANPKKVEIL